MHKSSMLRMKCFIDNYVIGGEGKKILDIGSFNVNGCYKMLLSDIHIKYVGLDIEEGPNVDIVADNIYSWDMLQDETFDYIISGQAFEHIEYPWMTIKEIYKKLKPNGIICIIAPNGLYEHRYPTDCYRYYADGMRAIAEWAGFEIIEVSVAGIPNEEVSSDWDDIWNDVCLVACRSESIRDQFVGKVMFPIERRYNPVHTLKRQYDFVSKWKCNGEWMDEMIINFIKRGKYDKVYVAGYENIGIVLAGLLQSKGIDHKIIKTEERFITEDCLFESGIMPEININEKRTLCILTILDGQKKWIKEVERQYHFSNIMYIDELINYEKE